MCGHGRGSPAHSALSEVGQRQGGHEAGPGVAWISPRNPRELTNANGDASLGIISAAEKKLVDLKPSAHDPQPQGCAILIELQSNVCNECEDPVACCAVPWLLPGGLRLVGVSKPPDHPRHEARLENVPQDPARRRGSIPLQLSMPVALHNEMSVVSIVLEWWRRNDGKQADVESALITVAWPYWTLCEAKPLNALVSRKFTV